MTEESADDRLRQIAECLIDGVPVEWQDIRASLPEQESSTIAALEALGQLFAHPKAEAGPGLVLPTRWAHLQVLEPWGDDGMSFTAADHSLGQEVLLTLVGPLDGDEALTRRLLHDARALAKVRHAHLATLHGADYRHDFMGYWTQLVRGRHLGRRVADEGPLDYVEACHVCVQVCSALAAMHAEGLGHGSLTPSTVVHTDEGRIVVRPHISEHSGMRVDEYEQTDIRGVGFLLLFLVTGASAPDDASLANIVETGSLRRRLPKRVRKVIRRCFGGAPPFANVRELSTELDHVLRRPAFGPEVAAGVAAVILILLLVLLLSR